MSILREGNLDMEIIMRIDWILMARSILSCHLTESFLVALAASVTVAIVTMAIWIITLMWRCHESVRVGLHNIELGAPLTIYVVCITIIVAPFAT